MTVVLIYLSCSVDNCGYQKRVHLPFDIDSRGHSQDTSLPWKARGWLTKEKKPVKNQDLWRELDVLTSRHRVKWQWVKGHAGNVDNEKCDLLAKEEIGKLHRQYTRSQLKELVVKFREGVETDENTLL